MNRRMDKMKIFLFPERCLLVEHSFNSARVVLREMVSSFEFRESMCVRVIVCSCVREIEFQESFEKEKGRSREIVSRDR